MQAALACARTDTFSVMPLAEVDDFNAFTMLMREARQIDLSPSWEALVRFAESAKALKLYNQYAGGCMNVVEHGLDLHLDPQIILPYVEGLLQHIGALKPRHVSSSYNAIGNFKDRIGDETGALHYYTLAYQNALPERISDQIYGVGNMGLAYIAVGDTIAARWALRRSVQLTALLEDDQDKHYNNAWDYYTLHRLFDEELRRDSFDYYLNAAYLAYRKIEDEPRRESEIALMVYPAFVERALRDDQVLLARNYVDTLRQRKSQLAPLNEARILQHTGNFEQAIFLLEHTKFLDFETEREAQDMLLALAQQTDDKARVAKYALAEIDHLKVKQKEAKAALANIAKTYTESFDRERALNAEHHRRELEVLQMWRRNAVTLVFAVSSLLIAAYLYRRYRVSNSRSQTLEALVTVKDVDLAKVNDVLEQQVKALEEFNQLLSHDLREPLRSISGFTTLLRRRIARYPELMRDFDYLDGAVGQLTHLHDGVELLRRTKEHFPQVKVIDLGASIADTASAVMLKYPGFEVNLDIPAGLQAVPTDSYLVSLVLRELLDNAAKFTDRSEPGAELTVTVVDTRIEMRVKDYGIGVDKAYHEQIFAVFKRLHRREEFGGAGIGLALARVATGKLGGQLTLEQSGAGSGSSFCFALRISLAMGEEMHTQLAGQAKA